MADSVFFDLDGTLTDSAEGITKCAQLALSHFGIIYDDLDPLKVFVGPPLREMFPKFGVPADRVEEAVKVFRSRYLTVGKFENSPYAGIPQMLSELKARGKKLFITTSKPETTAKEILSHFDLDGYFDCICGATMDGSRDSKESVISHLLTQTEDLGTVVMVGDTAFDVIGASAHGIPTIGVSWGYGKICDMESAGAKAIATTTTELVDLICQI
ncbi:MAG: HAD hydrolase-like protein [Clostridia bacterium]|nr:HAD hydrolase-like protein [Clostridia bacterium]